MCDTMVGLAGATANGQTLFAKNSDRPADECQPLVQRERERHPPGSTVRCRFLEIPQVAETFGHVGSRPYWCWGYEHGFNEHQVVIGNEALPSGIAFSEPKLIGMEILRLALERGRTAAEAVEVIADLVTRHGQGRFDNDAGIATYDNSYIVADPNEAYAVETAGHEWAVRRVERSTGISNVYGIGADWDRLSPGAEADALGRGRWERGRGRFDFAAAFTSPEYRAEALGSGSNRRGRSCAVLARRDGFIDAATMMAILSDHSDGARPDEPFQTTFGQQGGICVHTAADGTGGNTAASLVADLCADGSRLPVYWCSFYSPCVGAFLPLFSEGDLPQVLALGDREPDDASPWWLFHRLSAAIRAEPAKRAPIVRDRFRAMQEVWRVSAYDTAREGRRLLDRGETEAARRLLTGSMEESVTEALSAARELLAAFPAPRASGAPLPVT
jgi:dipeptidase